MLFLIFIFWYTGSDKWGKQASAYKNDYRLTGGKRWSAFSVYCLSALKIKNQKVFSENHIIV